MWKDNISFVLVEPREPGNIGAAARAMKNMGFSRLCLVRPCSPLTEEAWWMAHNAAEVLESSEAFDRFSDAIEDKALVVGTTRRLGKRRGVILPVDAGTRKIHELAQGNRIAIVFGREDRGLFNEEVEECGFLMTIPTSRAQASLNLSQAVLIVAYELSRVQYRSLGSGVRDRVSGEKKGARGIGGQESRAGGESVEPTVAQQYSMTESVSLVNRRELNTLYGRISQALKSLGYITRGDRDLEKKIMTNLKYLCGRSGLTDWEVKMLHGICSQIERKLGRGD